MRNVPRKSVLFVPTSFRDGDIDILRAGVCGACNVSISQALKAKNKCETYQFKWLKNKRVCCVPPCGSTDIEVNVHRHDFSWEDVCNSIGIASVSSPVDRLMKFNAVKRG